MARVEEHAVAFLDGRDALAPDHLLDVRVVDDAGIRLVRRLGDGQPPAPQRDGVEEYAPAHESDLGDVLDPEGTEPVGVDVLLLVQEPADVGAYFPSDTIDRSHASWLGFTKPFTFGPSTMGARSWMIGT